MNLMQDYIAVSKYARYLPEQNRRETWEETVNRYIHNVVTPALMTVPMSGALAVEIRDAILNREVMPSMRMLMTAGAALERDHMAGYNCLTGDTKVITQEYGAVRLDEIAGQTVTAMTPAGWREAEANYFGEKPTQRITFKPYFDRTNHRVVVDATPDHKWILATGGHTRNLQVGDKVNSLVAPIVKNQDYNDGVRHGIIFGDGSLNKRLSNGRYQHHVRLCGQKSEEMLKYFSSVSYPESYRGDPVGYWTCSLNCKEFPENKSVEYVAGFLWGWLLADGNQLSSDSLKLDSQKEGAYEWLVDNAATAGYVVVGVNYNNKPTNFGQRSNPLARITLKKAKEFVVESIAELDTQDTYCLTVPEEGCFALANGLLTGNCSFIAIDHPRAFDEVLYILTCGTGVGFSCESQFTNKLPEVAEEFHATDSTIVVSDSRIGWASSFRELVSLLYSGKVPRIDVSRVRAKGERLKTFGGRASGPQPLVDLFDYTVRLFKSAAGRKLTDIECHGLVCKVGEIVVVGGVRRSALISLSDLHSSRMRAAKSGNWWERFPEFALANNSAVYNERPTTGPFLEEWTALYDSKSGERGIYYRKGIRDKTTRIGRRDAELIVGTNPCGEIALRSAGLCNLTEVVVRAGDTVEELRRKVGLATILGTIQSTYTDFRYVRSVWQRNAEEERLLGVSLTGIYDNTLTNGSDGVELLADTLERLKEYAGEVNREYASLLGINPSVAITTVEQLAA